MGKITGRQRNALCKGAQTHCSLARTVRPTETALQTQMYGCREQLEKTVLFTSVTGLTVSTAEREKKKGHWSVVVESGVLWFPGHPDDGGGLGTARNLAELERGVEGCSEDSGSVGRHGA